MFSTKSTGTSVRLDVDDHARIMFTMNEVDAYGWSSNNFIKVKVTELSSTLDVAQYGIFNGLPG